MTSCALCDGTGPLRDSHILPEFVYRPSYDETHTAVFFDAHHGHRGKRRKGLTQYLLCSACEGKFSRWETYFANVWFNAAKGQRPSTLPGPPSQVIQICDLNYAQFKLFHLSVIWRAGVSSLPTFDNVRLGAQEKKLRNRLMESDPGKPTDYPFFAIALREPRTGGFQDQLVKGPDAARVKGHWVYTFIFGDVQWNYYVSSHESDRVVPVYFGLDGLLTLAVQDWTESPFVRDMAANMHKARRAGPNQRMHATRRRPPRA
jgi:hypothetical protein